MIDFLLNSVIYIFSFVVLLSFIVFFHELGHFQVARWCGIKVDVFSIGFGKVLLKCFDKHGTEWRISLLPLGGFVKFFGDAGPASNPSEAVHQEQAREDEEEAEEEGAPMTTQFPGNSEKERLAQQLTDEEKAVCFHFKPLWQKALVVAAGPFANFILAVVILTGLLWSMEERRIYEATISDVVADSPAAEAGFQPGDTVLSVNGRRVNSFQEMTYFVKLGTGETLVFEVDRGGEIVELTAVPRREELEDGFGTTARVGYLGVYGDMEAYRTVKYGPISAFTTAVAQVGDVLRVTVKFISRIFMGKEDLSQMGGPLKIGNYAGKSTLSGFDEALPQELTLMDRLVISFRAFLGMAAMISISVGFLNLLPLPVLDGGHLVFYAYEAIAGQPLSEKIQVASFKIGIVILLSLMVFITFNDAIQMFFS